MWVKVRAQARGIGGAQVQRPLGPIHGGAQSRSFEHALRIVGHPVTIQELQKFFLERPELVMCRLIVDVTFVLKMTCTRMLEKVCPIGVPFPESTGARTPCPCGFASALCPS